MTSDWATAMVTVALGASFVLAATLRVWLPRTGGREAAVGRAFFAVSAVVVGVGLAWGAMTIPGSEVVSPLYVHMP